MQTLHDTLPRLTPTPVAWGSYTSNANTHFFLCGFVAMNETLPNIDSMAKSLAELHEKGLSPNGKYGFPVPTCQGTAPQYTHKTTTGSRR